MTFSCEKNVILEAVNTVIKVVPSKSSIPVLEGIFVEITDDKKIRLVGSDIDIGIETFRALDNAEGCGAFVANAKTFGEMLSKLENGTVFFTLDEKNVLHMICGVIKYDLPCIDASLYPSMPMIEKSKSLSLKKSVLHSMLRQTLYAVSNNDTRPILRGALFDIEKESITVVASDTFRLAMRKEIFENPNEENFSFIVPGRTLSELTKIMKNDDENVDIGIASTHISFEFDETKIQSKLLAGEFLNYKNIIPKEFKTTVKVDTDNLKRAIERAAVLISEKIKNPVRMSFGFDSVVVSCRTPEGSSLTDEISAEIKGENIEIGFNDKYLIDALNASEKDKIHFNLNSPVTPMCITPEDSDSFVFLISPMRLRND